MREAKGDKKEVGQGKGRQEAEKKEGEGEETTLIATCSKAVWVYIDVISIQLNV